jgi:hypothetical protein
LRVLSVAGLAGLVAATTLGLGTTACGSCNAPSGGAGADAGATAVIHPPVPAPAGLLAEAWVRAPDAAWSKIQQGVSGAVALLPPTVGELVCAAVGLDAALAPVVDGKGLSYVVLGADPAGAPGATALQWVVALPLTDPARAAALLLDAGDAGDAGARYTAHGVAGMRALSSAEHPLHATAALAVEARGWLVLASSEDDLARLGPYAVRTMPTRPAPAESAVLVADVPQSALAGPLSTLLGARWGEMRAWLAARDDEQRAKHGGRAPDFGDPRPIVEAFDGAVKRRVALLAQARGAHLLVDAADDEVHAELAVTPGTDEASAAELGAMAPGDARPLVQAPGESVLGVMVRDDPKTREQDLAKLGATLDQVMGARLHEDDTKAIHAAVTDWTRARGPWWTAALAWGPSDASRGVWLRTPVTSQADASRAVRELVELSHRTVLEDMLASSMHLRPAAVTRVDADSLGKVSLATFAGIGHQPPAGGFGVAWGAGGKTDTAPPGELLVAAGEAAPQLLSSLAAPAHRLGDDPRSARALAALGDRATVALFAQPLRFSSARGDAADSAPLVLAWGRKGDGLWARIELADRVLRELLRLKAGL